MFRSFAPRWLRSRVAGLDSVGAETPQNPRLAKALPRGPKQRGPRMREQLEPRLAPAVVSYDGAAQALLFTAETGDADAVSVSAMGATAHIVVGNGATISLVGAPIP